ncbi:MAG TPA: TssQ family T6SS-associated lipoprotein [Burkholderiales bacterium]|nr:TssQ family T6SS-associated lipoprotein [Burkholderiales bacterium]
MNLIRAAALAATALLALAGCESAPVKEATREVKSLFQGKGGEEDLAAGIREYEDGNYREAETRLQAALGAGLKAKTDQAKAHKYLAFTYCVTNREKPCRDEFRRALDADPGFDLSPAEAGHPIWGPVFRSVKGKK